jgi:D-beta-D-heptose 7-phosphate kinase/D-beta-D-heptose 1-phosphate adenosyltransferase
MHRDLLKTITNLGSPKIMLVGDYVLDSYVYGDALRISPEAPVPVLKVVQRSYSCGGAGSVAADLAVLGAKPICIGIIGADDNGAKLKEMLVEAGADITGIISIKSRPTVSKQRLIGLAQHIHRQQLLRIDDEVTDELTAEQYGKIIEAFTKRLGKVDVVCLQDYNKGVLSGDVCREMISLAKSAGKKVLIDPAPVKDYSMYAGACLITPNRKETSLAVGFDIENSADARRAAEILSEKLSLEAVVVTMDKDGAFLLVQGQGEHLPTIPRNVYDVTGAGDMVLAMLAVSIAAGCDYKTAVQLSNIAGGIEVEKFGCVTVSIDEIVNEIIAANKGKSGKIHAIDTLAAELNYHRHKKESIVFTNGCFDVLHRGHTEYLKFCKAQGDVVVLGLNSDSSISGLKGPDRPINNQHDRAAVLASLETVDYIVVFDEPDPLSTIEHVRPDVLVKGEDWADKGVIGREFVEAHGGKVVLAPLVGGKSSTATIEKMQSLDKKEQEK